MKRIHNLSELNWKVAGYTPYVWQLARITGIGAEPIAEQPHVSAMVPGSVQKALFDAGVLPDWFVGMNAPLCEWVENRHWIYTVTIPQEWLKKGKKFLLRCLGLDYCGFIYLNQKQILEFCGSHISHVVDLTEHLTESNNILEIIFTCPPRWLGQFGYTSRMTEWKTRFNYFWDWVSRLVQVGIWDDVLLEEVDETEIESVNIENDVDLITNLGKLRIEVNAHGSLDCKLIAELSDNTKTIYSEEKTLSDLPLAGFVWKDLNVNLWWPHTLGNQPLYKLTVRLVDNAGQEHDRVEKRIGFRHIAWKRCKGSPENSEPWICVVNGKPLFLQGVGWIPIRPNYADLKESDYRIRLELYRKLGFNILRAMGVAILEKRWFYDICDELGIMVWQEFPLSSSGVENYPPDDEKSIKEMSEIARSFICRRKYHPSLVLWCGGNELMNDKDFKKDPDDGFHGFPIGLDHPLIKKLKETVEKLDPTRRFIPTSPYGPKFFAHQKNYGKGIHWDIHGPWKPQGKLEDQWIGYWKDDDALLRSEVGAPGPCSAELIRRYKGNCDEIPGTLDNPLWRRAPWWTEWPEFVEQNGREPDNLEEYVKWGQQRQAHALSIAAESCKKRFPRCGGILFWMGHDCYPVPSNTAIIDFEGRPKPAALALAEVFRKYPSTQDL